MLFIGFLHKSYVWEKSCSRDTGQNALSQSDGWVFKINSPEQIDESASFFACWCKFTKIKRELKIFGLVVVRNGCGQSGLWALKVTVTQEWTNGINWFFACWHNFTQINRRLKVFRVSLIENGCGQSGNRTHKFTVSEEWADGINWFLACWYRFTKIKIWSEFFGWHTGLHKFISCYTFTEICAWYLFLCVKIIWIGQCVLLFSALCLVDSISHLMCCHAYYLAVLHSSYFPDRKNIIEQVHWVDF